MKIKPEPVTNDFKQDLSRIALLMVCIIFARILPHIPNVSPLLVLALLSPRWFNKGTGLAFIFSALLITDVFIAKQMQTPIFGGWSLFTYSGLASIFALGYFKQAQSHFLKTGLLVISTSLAYWTWTNFGVWLMEAYYPMTPAGLVACYVAALPFLKNALVGDCGWFVSIMFITNILNLSPSKKLSTQQFNCSTKQV